MHNRKTIHIISQAHLDLAWLWRVNESYSEVLNTFNSIVKLMNQCQQFTFSYSNAITYSWVKHSAPDLFKEIGRLVAAGRWEICGGWMVEADCNLPSMESLIRQALYGKELIKDYFDADVRIAYSPDAFGHCEGLPKILRQTNYDYYVFSKPRDGNKLPHLFRWRANDGSEIIAWRIHKGYATGPDDTPDMIECYIRDAAKNNFPYGCNHTAFFLGVGDHGGGPSALAIQRIIEMQADSTLPNILFSTLRDFFHCLKSEGSLNNQPVIHGELAPYNIGCYSANRRIKERNRKCESLLQKAEMVATLADRLKLISYPGTLFRSAWERLLLNQFHDIIAGTCVENCYRDSEESLGFAAQVARELLTSGLHAIAQTVDNSQIDNNVLFVFNPLPWTVVTTVSIDMFTAIDGAGGPRVASVVDRISGERIPVQFCTADAPYGPWLKDWKKLFINLELPPCGYRSLELSADVAIDSVSKEFARWTPDDSVLGISAFQHILSDTAALVIGYDNSDTFGHERTILGENISPINLGATIELENGIWLQRTKLSGTSGRSEFCIEVNNGRIPNSLRLRLYGNFQEPHSILKFKIPTVLDDVRFFCLTPAAVTERLTNGTEMFGHGAFALHGKYNGKEYTLAVYSTNTYSVSASGGTLLLTICRSVEAVHYGKYCRSEEEGKLYLDLGVFSEEIELVLIEGCFDATAFVRTALEFQSPPDILVDTAHKGIFPPLMSFLQMTAKTALFTGCKIAEHSSNVVFRVFECSGTDDTVVLQSPIPDLNVKKLIIGGEIKTISPCSLVEVSAIELL